MSAAPRWFVRWYMSRIAGRYCPCEWPIKSKLLMRLCGRIDDAAAREAFRDCCGFWLSHYNNNTTVSTGTTVVVKPVRWRRSVGGETHT